MTDRRLMIGITGLGVLVAIGTAGYIFLEGASPIDALYLVLITITTVGFGEVIELDTAGRILTMGIMVTGVGLTLYTATAGIEQLFLFGRAREKTRTLKRIRQMKDHVIVCGHGRVGRGVAESLKSRGVDFVVIEADSRRAELAAEAGITVVEGDATQNTVLESVHVTTAKALVACVTEESDNLVITLSARSLAAGLHIIARAALPEWEEKLRLAGANRVVLPQRVGSERMAAMAVETTISEVFEVVVGGRAIEFTVEELTVSPSSDVVGTSIRDAAIRERTGAMILAVENITRTSLLSPSPDHVLEAGTVVVVVGTQAEIERVEVLLTGAVIP